MSENAIDNENTGKAPDTAKPPQQILLDFHTGLVYASVQRSSAEIGSAE